MKPYPLVSVNIRTYNSAQTLRETLESVKRQSYPNVEIVISDGFSKDRSVAIAERFGARVHFADKLGDARKQNYKHSRGKYILSLDSDQSLEQRVIEECVRLCEKKKFDAVTISEKSIIQKGTLIEKLIAYDKWVIDKNRDADATFGTACPRFFRKTILSEIRWPKNLAVFDDTILYNELTTRGAKVTYLSHPSIFHHEVSDWRTFMKKFFRYGKGYFGALRVEPGTIAAHSLPRRSYFSTYALSKPGYFVGLLVLYSVKVGSAGLGAFVGLLQQTFLKTKRHETTSVVS